ncbi:Uncharacterised protein [uncultured Clostridium sp.]|jgi:hypothetical protein|nr:Uncharacterised protein [uncultured Clostridium sp.]
MYYKILKNGNVIDVLDRVQFVKYQLKNRILMLCNEEEAQGILSSDGEKAYHVKTLQKFPVDLFPTVTAERIEKQEYDRLKELYLMTPEQIIDNYTKELIRRGIL